MSMHVGLRQLYSVSRKKRPKCFS